MYKIIVNDQEITDLGRMKPILKGGREKEEKYNEREEMMFQQRQSEAKTQLLRNDRESDGNHQFMCNEDKR